ncbi:hypothetical protein RFEPED_1312 [Rickettsia felis str. Pedreira]|uniref:Uncharacterized protein n=1 Tax=Rickettsia felis str. Pedreira TaxID=1359196 RepID=A0A0F3MTY9_RICFI|nr:hypothetical protein RFEPED_1312 [Rickettsia felis str. Pedreira]
MAKKVVPKKAATAFIPTLPRAEVSFILVIPETKLKKIKGVMIIFIKRKKMSPIGLI